MMMIIMTTTIITAKIREAAVAEEDHEIGKGGGGGMIQYRPLAFRQGNLEGFDAVAMHISRYVHPGSRVCELYAGVGVLVLTEFLYHHCM